MSLATPSALDVSDRDLQKSEKQFAPLQIVRYLHADRAVRLRAMSMSAILPVELRQNGEVRQKARTSQMIYSVAEIVSFASQSLTLLAGRCHSDRHAVRRRTDPGGRSIWRQ